MRIEAYPDRLRVTNPGGLHGEISRTRLFSEPLTSSRNSHLARRTSTNESTRGGARHDPSGSAQATPKDGGDRRRWNSPSWHDEARSTAGASPTRQTPADATITVLPRITGDRPRPHPRNGSRIPRHRSPDLRRVRSLQDVEDLADELGIHPGIVVGRLHHERIWPHDRGNRLRERLELAGPTD